MNNGGEAADQMVREALQFSDVAIKLTALGFKNIVFAVGTFGILHHFQTASIADCACLRQGKPQGARQDKS